MDYIIINKIGSMFWYVPSIFTISKRKWHARPYKNLKKLLVVEHLFDDNLVIQFNGDKELVLFNMLLQFKAFPLFLKKSDLAKLECGQMLQVPISKLKPTLFIDRKSLKLFRNGIVPFCSIQFLNKEFCKEDYIIWRKGGWVMFKNKSKLGCWARKQAHED